MRVQGPSGTQDEGTLPSQAVTPDASGKVSVKQADDEGPVGTGVGLLTGSLIGLIVGPVGLAIGAYAGTVRWCTTWRTPRRTHEVGQFLQPGKAAVVAEVWEDWVLPVDTRMEALGGVVFRRMRGEIVDAQIERDAAAFRAELAALEAEDAKASAEAKAKLRAKIDAAKAKLQAMQGAIQARSEASKQETEAKIKSLREQAAKARGERKAKVEGRIAELQAEQKRRSDARAEYSSGCPVRLAAWLDRTLQQAVRKPFAAASSVVRENGGSAPRKPGTSTEGRGGAS
jgi:uncharacterized membrane protein